MKTLRDTNNNNSNITNTTTQQHFSPSNITRQNLMTSNGSLHHNSTIGDSESTQNRYQQVTSSKLTTQNPNPPIFNGDTNQFSSILQSYLTKTDSLNPLLYLQLMNNANTMFMQQLSSIQNNNDLPNETMNSKKLQADSNIFVPKTRPMTQDEIAEHARLVYQRALQRNQLQQHNDLMKHFYETLNVKQQDSSSIKTTNHNQVPTVPNVTNIAYDVLDTMITSPSSCQSIKEASIDAALSSLSLLSVDDSKMISNTSSILDPGAPVFIPRQNRSKFDDDNETSSSSSVSDFNDFHYLDQFLDEFYNSDNENDNHLLIQKSPTDNNNNKHSIDHNILGQGDTIEKLTCETNIEKQECQYSIYELLNRYRNPRCHLVLPEWSRLSLILPNVCSMRGHTYKIKRYFAYRRRLNEDETPSTNISVQG